MKKFLFFVFVIWIIFICGYYFYEKNKNQNENKTNITIEDADSFDSKNSDLEIEPEVHQEEYFPQTHSSKFNYKYYNFRDKYKITVRNAPNSILGVAITVPQYQKDRQVVKYLKYSMMPTRIYKQNGNRVAYFEIKHPKTETIIEVTGQIGVHTYDLKTAKEKPVVEILSPKDRKKYTSSEKHIESDDPDIIAKAKELKAEGTLKTVQNIYYFVQKNMTYEYNHEDSIGAKEALKRMKGKCTEYAALMVALCRANGIPARVVCGCMINNQKTNRHAWVEVYLDQYGWVTFEPTVLSSIDFDFSVSPYEYLLAGYNILMPSAIKLKIYSIANSKTPQPDAMLMTFDETTFYDAKTNQLLK